MTARPRSQIARERATFSVGSFAWLALICVALAGLFSCVH